jgi:phospholipid/cholesterol/gamma-HCH transport system substrate-binding protein
MAKKLLETEIKVGLFLTIGLMLLALAILFLGGADSIFTRYNLYAIHYPSVEGLMPGSKVMLGGVNVGVVKNVSFDTEVGDIRVDISVKRNFARWIRADTAAEIATLGMLGDKYIALSSGSATMPELQPAGVIQAKESRDLTQFISKGDNLVITLGKIAASMDRVLQKLEAGNRSDIIFGGLAETSKNLAQASARINGDLEKAQLRESLKHLNQILAKVNNGTGTLGALVNDPALYYDVRALLGGVNRNQLVRNIVRKAVRDADEASANEEQADTKIKPKK